MSVFHPERPARTSAYGKQAGGCHPPVADFSMGPQSELMERTTFGGTPAEADALLALVLSGRKTATCWAARFGKLSQVGKRVAVCDSQGRARAVLETVSLDCRRFCDIDERWARLEGEGDLSLGHWRSVHEAFFRREGHFAEDMELWCEQFRVVERLLPGD